MMKRILGLFLVLLLLLCPFSAFAAEESGDVTVEINGELITFDVPPQIMNNRTMVPMRKIFETLGVKVEWLGETRQIFSVKGEDAIVFQIEVPRVLIHNFRENTDNYVELDQAPVIVNNRTLVPIRAVSESLGAKVDWVDAERKVVITTE